VAGGGSVADHPLRRDVAFDRAVELVLARRSDRFTRFDGNLGGHRIPGPGVDGFVSSPTRLQGYATNPHDYLMESLLRVDIPENPEDLLEMSPLEKGSLVHEVLEEFLAEALARTVPPAPGARWTDADRRRLLGIAARRCDAAEATGKTGRELFWKRDRRRILADLLTLLDDDSERLAGGRLAPLAAELPFGFGDDPPLAVTLSDGRTLLFRGAADRVDRGTDGSFVVIDYKSGRPFDVPADDPTACGTLLQLPVYAHAVRAVFGAPNAPVTAAYWFATRRGGFRWQAMPLSDEVAARVDEVLRAITDGIAAGAFPCALEPPSSWSWKRRTYSDPDARGTRDRYREWERKLDAPELTGYLALAGYAPDEDGRSTDG
jgi:hypothetical protein